MDTGTILISSETRERLKEIGRKNQTYDQLISELIELKKGRDENSTMFKGSKYRELGANSEF